MKVLSIVLLYWSTQSLRNYDKQRNTVTYTIIIEFWGWPKLLCYATSVENIRYFLHKEA